MDAKQKKPKPKRADRSLAKAFATTARRRNRAPQTKVAAKHRPGARIIIPPPRTDESQTVPQQMDESQTVPETPDESQSVPKTPSPPPHPKPVSPAHQRRLCQFPYSTCTKCDGRCTFPVAVVCHDALHEMCGFCASLELSSSYTYTGFKTWTPARCTAKCGMCADARSLVYPFPDQFYRAIDEISTGAQEIPDTCVNCGQGFQPFDMLVKHMVTTCSMSENTSQHVGRCAFCQKPQGVHPAIHHAVCDSIPCNHDAQCKKTGTVEELEVHREVHILYLQIIRTIKKQSTELPATEASALFVNARRVLGS